MSFSSIFIWKNLPCSSAWVLSRWCRVEWAASPAAQWESAAVAVDRYIAFVNERTIRTFFIITNQFSLFWKGQCMVRRHLTIANRPMRYCVTSDRLIYLRIMGCGLFIFLCVPAMNRPPTNSPSILLESTLCFLFFYTHMRICYCRRVHYIEVFFTEGIKKSVHCSELGGVHYIEVHLQQKLIGGPRYAFK